MINRGIIITNVTTLNYKLRKLCIDKTYQIAYNNLNIVTIFISFEFYNQFDYTFSKKIKFFTGLRKRELFLDSKSECHNGLLMLTCLQCNHLLSEFSDLSSDLLEPKSVISVETELELPGIDF